MNIRYNTRSYNRLFKETVKRYQDCNKFTDIEGRVRAICIAIHESGLGVSAWSCEGHYNEDGWNSGYIMIMPRNRGSAAILTDIFHNTAGRILDVFGWEQSLRIEHDLASYEVSEELVHSYPCLVIRNSGEMTEAQADKWWDSASKSICKQLHARIKKTV